jgi:hypothetical protein
MESSRENTITSVIDNMQSATSPKPLDFASIKENFYNSLEESDTLIDYFCVVGLDQVRVQQIAAAKGSLPPDIISRELLNMRPSLIWRFPPEDKKGLKIDPGVEASF